MIKNFLKSKKNKIINNYTLAKKSDAYLKKYKSYAFSGNKCFYPEQYEAVITRWYHVIEKGLAYVNFRAGFGEKNIESLLISMENYVADGYDVEAFFFKTALSALKSYIEKNRAYGVENPDLEKRIALLSGESNDAAGIIKFRPLSDIEIQSLGYKEFVENRHSMRHFSTEAVNLETLIKAVELAQHTPSACNRQGWRTIIISDKDKLNQVLLNHNGSQGFGQEIDKLLLITADIRAFNLDREIFQPFIDGGMYAQSVLNALHYYRIASVPLSASLHKCQEKNIREILGLDDAEVLIMFIGIGNYPNDEECQTARSERRESRYLII